MFIQFDTLGIILNSAVAALVILAAIGFIKPKYQNMCRIIIIAISTVMTILIGLSIMSLR